MSENQTEDKYAKSTNRKYGIVDDEISEKDVYRHDENPVMLSQFDEDGTYWLGIGSRVGLDTSILFDRLHWTPGEFSGTLWLERETKDACVTVANISHWHPATPMVRLGLVGEWIAERIDLSEFETEHQCPDCGATVLDIRLHWTCDNTDCEFYRSVH